ncbi:MAG TPA: BatD family protein [Candidatus Omnitrophota bacterium]|nr:BatD family protein [Candidatus Omnitrophota bacterium]
MRAGVDKNVVTIGDHIIYTISVRPQKGMDVGFPSFPQGKKIGIFELKDSGIKSKKDIFGNKVATGWYDLVAYEAGKTFIPALDVKYKYHLEKEPKIIQTKPIEINIESVLPANTVIYDIKDIKGPLYYFEINWFFVAGMIFLAFFLAVLIYLNGRMRRGPVKLPHETALEELESIRALLLQSGDIKEFYVRISDCIRFYIERSFAVKASEMTTEEFLNSMKTSPTLTLEQKDLLKVFLSSCDLVKFAKHNPAALEIENVFASAKRFVEETSPKKER